MAIAAVSATPFWSIDRRCLRAVGGLGAAESGARRNSWSDLAVELGKHPLDFLGPSVSKDAAQGCRQVRIEIAAQASVDDLLGACADDDQVFDRVSAAADQHHARAVLVLLPIGALSADRRVHGGLVFFFFAVALVSVLGFAFQPGYFALE